MVRSAITFSQVRQKAYESPAQVYWSLMHGEFPWCLDESEETETPSDLTGSFDLVIADPPRIKRRNGGRMRTPLDRSQPETGWLQYAELFLKPGGSILISAPIESIGSYASAAAAAGLDYRATYVWSNPEGGADLQSGAQGVEAIQWAVKGDPQYSPALPSGRFINAPPTAGGKQWLIELMIEAFTQQGMSVLEPFTNDAGVLSVCQKMRRYCLGIARKRSCVKQIRDLLAGPLKQTA